MIITSFYVAAYLLSKNYTISLIKRDKNEKKLYHFIGNRDLMIKDIKEFRSNKKLQDYIEGVVHMRKLSEECYKDWDKEKLMNNTNTVCTVSE